MHFYPLKLIEIPLNSAKPTSNRSYDVFIGMNKNIIVELKVYEQNLSTY